MLPRRCIVRYRFVGGVPWAKSPRSAADQEADKFHMMLGYCISAWAEVDDLLFRIFRDCVGPYEQCAIIYYKTPGLEARFSLTDEIVKSVLPKKLPGEHDHPSVQAWNRLYQAATNCWVPAAASHTILSPFA